MHKYADKRPSFRKFGKDGLHAGLLLALTALQAGAAPSSQAQTAAAAPPAQATATEPEGAGYPVGLRLVTTDQYLNTIGYIFGPDVRPDIQFAPITRTEGLLGVGATVAGVTDAQIEKYQAAAALVAAAVVDPVRRQSVIPCKPKDAKAADDACAGEFLGRVGELFFRRPLSEAKRGELIRIAGTTANQVKDFYVGVSVALEGILVSPRGLFVDEVAEPDPARPGRQRLDAYSLASRLSLFLWNAAPDDALLDAARSGELQTAKGRARAVDRMLASPRLEAGMRAFFDDMLGLDLFDNLAKDPLVYPSFTAVTAADAREQTLRTVIDQLITKKRDYRDLFTTRETFISPALATLYRVPSPKLGWAPYTFPEDSPRTGLLTQVSFLAGHSHPGRSSPTVRGKALREALLCQKVPPPPPGIDFTAFNDSTGSQKTVRERLLAHQTNPTCAGCHKITDQMGLALENFDGVGRFRREEGGIPVDASGTLDGTAFKDVVGLGQALRNHPALPACLVKRVYSYGTGRSAGTGDRRLLAFFNAQFSSNGYQLTELLRTIALSDAFVAVQEPPANQTASVSK